MMKIVNKIPTQRLSIQAFNICWHGFEAKSQAIATAIAPGVDAVFVIYSNPEDKEFNGVGTWIMVPNDWLYGNKFIMCQKHFSGDIHLQIQADAHTDNWPTVIHRCRQAFMGQSNLGVWAPLIDYSPWLTEFVSVRSLPHELIQVLQTDGVLWAFNAGIDDELRGYHIEKNNSGWGIEQVAICISLRLGQLVIRDLAVTVKHPQSTGYNKQQAMNDKVRMTERLGFLDITSYRMIVYCSKWREKLALANNTPCFVRHLLDTALVLISQTWIIGLRMVARFGCVKK